MVSISTPWTDDGSEPMAGQRLLAAVTRLADAMVGDSSADGDAFQGPAREALREAREAERRIGDQATRIAHLERLARWDPLTGVLNRRGFEDAFERVLSGARRHGETGILVYVDIDGFTRVNDARGHGAGDELLRDVARTLVAGVRDTDYVARVGGDEFAVLLTRTSREDGISRAESLDAALNDRIVPSHGDDPVVGVSLGIQAYRPQDRGDEILDRADAAMYRAKRLRDAIRAEGDAPRTNETTDSP